MMGRPGNGGNETHTFTSTVSDTYYYPINYLCCVMYCRTKKGAVGNLNLASRGDRGCVMAVQKDRYQGTYTLINISFTIVCGVAI